MSQTSETLTHLEDGDIILVFRKPQDTVRRKAYRTTWKTVREMVAEELDIGSIQASIDDLARQPGPPGITPKVSVGAVTSAAAGSAAKVTNTGTAPDVMLNFTIPAGAAGKDGTPKRVERYTGTVAGSAGIATITFPEFASAPLGDVVITWDAAQMVTGSVTAITKTTATVKVMKSVATLLLNASPFAVAPAGTAVTIQVVGN